MKHLQAGRVSTMMNKRMVLVVLAVAVAACGSKQSPPVSNAGGGEQVAPVQDTRTELERRRDAACETLGPKITACAVEDAKRDLAAGKITQKQFDADTSIPVQRKNTEEFIKACESALYSTRQIRVLEVCQQEESECEPLLACLDHLNKP
jgi:hypothetical protein